MFHNKCKRGLGIDLDYRKLYNYLKGKYPLLEKVQYFEGDEVGDAKKRNEFNAINKAAAAKARGPAV